MTLFEINCAEAIRALLLDPRLDKDEMTSVVFDNRLLLARVIEYYSKAWIEAESVRIALRVVTGYDAL